MGCGSSSAVVADAPAHAHTHAQPPADTNGVRPVSPKHANAAPNGAAAMPAPSGAPATTNGSAAASADASKPAHTPAAATSGSAPLPPIANNDHRNIKDDYQFGRLLGKGGFGEVYEATRKTDHRRVAIKSISKVKFTSKEDRDSMVTEVELMARLRGHRNVVELAEYRQDRACFWIVCELCTGGELMDRIIRMSHFSERVASRYFGQMLRGVKHCHDHGVVHRDLKPENFLLESDANDAELKLTDFGLSCSISSPDEVIHEACGSAYYIAPEIFTRSYTRAVDAWALGIILYLLLSGTVPFGFNAETENEVYISIQRDSLRLGPQWNSISAAARELVTGLLEKDPYKRYTIEQALAHPWVTGDAATDTAIDRSLVSSMVNFNARNRFKKAALKLVASTLTADDVKSLRTAFHKIDKDNTGFITFAEMKAALQEGGFASGAELDNLMRNLDQDGDGKISWQEFLEATAERRLVALQGNMWYAFCEYDRDGDGKITVDELRAVMKDEPREMVERYIKEFDTDNDGTINYEEFMRMLLPKDLKYRISKYS